jgi:PAS domain S-box-containing protein
MLAVLIAPEDRWKYSLFLSAESISAGEQINVGIRVSDRLLNMEFRYSDQKVADGVVLRRGIVLEVKTGTMTNGDAPPTYEELFEKLPIGVVIHFQGIVQFANSHAHCIVGASRPGQLVGCNVMDFVHPDYSAFIHERTKQVVHGHPVPMIEEKFVRLDGHVIDVETMAFPFIYKGKSAVQVIFRDISERKKTEAQVRRNETLFTQLFQNVPMAVVMLDENGKVSEINRGFEQMFGYGKHELRGRNLNDFIVPDDLRSEGIDLNNLITSNRVVSIESIRRHKSGKLINVILCGVPVILDSEAIGIYGVYVDITDRKRV